MLARHPRSTIRRTMLGACVLTAVLGSTVPAARAASEAETLVGGWLDQIRASGAKVETGALVYTAGDDRLEIKDLKILPPGKDGKPDGAIRVPSAVFVGLSAGPNGGLAAKALAIGGIEGGSDDKSVTFSLAAVEGRDIALPGFTDYRYDEKQPFRSQAELFRRLATARIGGFTIGRFAAHVMIDDGPLDFAYDGVAVADLAEGRLARLSSGAASITGPSKDGPVDVKIGTIELTGYDFGAYARLFDDTAYVGGKGDGVWKTVQGSVTMNGISVNAGPVKVALARIAGADVRMRQFDRAPGAVLEKLIRDPKSLPEAESARFSMDIMRSISIGSYALEGFTIAAPDLDSGAIGRVLVSQVSSDGIGEISIDGLAFQAKGGAFQLGRFAIGKVGFPDYADVVRALEASKTPGVEIDPMSLVPTIGHFGIDGLVVDVPDKGRLQLGAFAIDLGGFIRAMPTVATVALRHLIIPAGFADTAEERQLFKRLGYERLDMSGDIAMAWDEKSQDLKIETVAAAVADAGVMTAQASFGGIPRVVFERPDQAQVALATATVKSFSVAATNGSLIDRVLRMVAEDKGKSLEAYRTELIDRMVKQLEVLPDVAQRRRFQEAVTTFLKVPKAIRVTAKIAAPVPATQLVGIGVTAPQQIPGLLKLDAEAER